ncbi:hypothetical protein STTU_p0103 (plasmid) [Streptomyces sp. Tu6071]|nr:hypothetical protein STTU_p0103 [Streptomyces sp. Tu6071]
MLAPRLRGSSQTAHHRKSLRTVGPAPAGILRRERRRRAG